MDTLGTNIDQYYKDQIALLQAMVLDLEARLQDQKREIAALQELLRNK